MTEIFTIGHSRHDIAAFATLLQRRAITLLADIRRKPWSGRYPQFNRERLARSLHAAGIDYRHFEALGGYRESPPGSSRNDAWRDGFLRAYADHALTSDFAAAFADLAAAAKQRRVAIMCAEAAWRDCHRQILTDYLIAANFTVTHIGPDGEVEPARLAPTARVEASGRVVYPAPVPRQGALDL